MRMQEESCTVDRDPTVPSDRSVEVPNGKVAMVVKRFSQQGNSVKERKEMKPSMSAEQQVHRPFNRHSESHQEKQRKSISDHETRIYDGILHIGKISEKHVQKGSTNAVTNGKERTTRKDHKMEERNGQSSEQVRSKNGQSRVRDSLQNRCTCGNRSQNNFVELDSEEHGEQGPENGPDQQVGKRGNMDRIGQNSGGSSHINGTVNQEQQSTSVSLSSFSSLSTSTSSDCQRYPNVRNPQHSPARKGCREHPPAKGKVDHFACELYQAVQSILPSIPPQDPRPSNGHIYRKHKSAHYNIKDGGNRGPVRPPPPPPPPPPLPPLPPVPFSSLSSSSSGDSHWCKNIAVPSNKEEPRNRHVGDGRSMGTFLSEDRVHLAQKRDCVKHEEHGTHEEHLHRESTSTEERTVIQVSRENRNMPKSHFTDQWTESTDVPEMPNLKTLLRAPSSSHQDSIGSCGTLECTNLESSSDQSGAEILVTLYKTGDTPLGATIVQYGHKIVVGRIIRGGAAEKSGQLKEGDELIRVNGVDLRRKSIHEVCDILAVMRGELCFTIFPRRGSISQDRSQTSAKHLRALFDYDPEDDYYLPCRELGLSFRKGDILHVISMEDTNWWQAHRQGDNQSPLPGLIPSASFQIQRECCRLEKGLEGDLETRRTHKRRSTSMFISDGTRVSSISSDDGRGHSKKCTDGVVLAYEEVALYLPHSNRKRPLVLVAPAHVGHRHLIQKLVEMKSGKVSQVVYHTSRPRKPKESDGGRYYFLSRQQFQDYVSKKKFIEWGIYQKHFYGTSYDSIRRVIEQGKTCVLTLKPQSLQAIRIRDIRPFIVFISPPPFERLKGNIDRERALLNKPPSKDHEVLNIIVEAAYTERKYGHYFDKILINYDNDQTVKELMNDIRRLESEPQWCPVSWL